jgi:hypothetical protein
MRGEKLTVDVWIIVLQVGAFGAFVSFSSYLTYRRRMNQNKRMKQKQAVLV